MWCEEGYFRREPYLPDTKIAFSNYGVSVGLQAVDGMAKRVQRLNRFLKVTALETNTIMPPSPMSWHALHIFLVI